MTASSTRIQNLLASLEQMAGGDVDHRAELSDARDEIDALAYAINVVVGELAYATRKLEAGKQQAEAANAAKTEFLHQISHEIRTPLAVILGAAELLTLPSLGEPQRTDLSERIVRQGRALATLLDDLLDLAKVEARRLVFDSRPLSPYPLVCDVVASLQGEAERRRVKVVVEPPAEQAGVLADPHRFRQILMNVIGNAIKFAPGGEVHVAQRSEDAPRVVVFDVSDNGIGFDDGAAHLFEPYQQSTPDIGRRFGGTGLGLALSKRLAQGMGGDLCLVTAAPGKGSTFRIVLQAAHIDPSPAPHDRQTSVRLDGLRILLADDDPDVRKVTGALLAGSGATVVEVDDGMDAIDHGRRDRFDMILMDLSMPGASGLDAARALRASGVRTPILALTAAALATRDVEYRQAGCDGLVSKPIEFDRLAAAIVSLVGG